MNAHAVTRALLRLATSGAVLAKLAQGRGHGVFPRGDKRRRPTARLDDEAVRQLEAEGVVEAMGDVLVLTVAGRARVRRDAATGEELWKAPLDDEGPLPVDPAAGRGLVFVVTRQRVRAFDAATGQLQWTRTFDLAVDWAHPILAN